MVLKRTALLSVSDKTDIVDFAKGLVRFGFKILSTGGTAKLLKENNIEVLEVSSVTGFPEMLDGRVKTLHPKIHGGLLGRRDNPKHLEEMLKHGIEAIDLVAVNLYPFEKSVSMGCSFEEAIEEIDIGGPALIRSASKNFESVVVAVDWADYKSILSEMVKNKGSLSRDTKLRLAQKAFLRTAEYDAAIHNYLLGTSSDKLEEEDLPEILKISSQKIQNLRYGENPHQRGAIYSWGDETPSVTGAKFIQGKELSFNNYLDADAAMRIVLEFNEIAVAIVKHTNPCGVALSDVSITDAYLKALESDPISVFGGIVAANRIVDEDLAKALSELFLEVVIAPDFDEKAINILSAKKNLRVLAFGEARVHPNKWDLKRVSGGLLLQDTDFGNLEVKTLPVVTERKPSDEEYLALGFCWKVVKHVKSNAIVLGRNNQIISVGAGQMSRIDSVKIAIMRAKLPILESVAASDAFFPFRDSIDEFAKAGVCAVIQPGGSRNDKEVIAAANEHNIAMLFTNMRHFKH